jgi:hypothetical protein
MRHPRAATAAAVASILLAAAAVPAFAARTDLVVLQNGDRITCEVIQMRRGKLQIKTDDAGAISIEWDKIASLTTADQYELTLQDESQLLGRFRPGAAAGAAQIVDDTRTISVSLDDVAAVNRIKATFVQRIDGSVDLGASYSKSSGVGDLWLNTKATYRRPQFTFGSALSTTLTRQPDSPDTSRYTLANTFSRYRKTVWIFTTLALFEGNRDLGFTFRGTLAESIGRYVVRSRHVELMISGGLAAGRETPIDASRVTNFDAVSTTTLSVFTYDYPTTGIDVSLLVFPSLDDPGRVRLNADSTLRRELFKDFFVAFTVYDAFDNRPKSASAKQNDVGGSLSFGYTF